MIVLRRHVFRTTAIPREGTLVRTFHLHAALDHGAYGCRQRHQLKFTKLTRGVEAPMWSVAGVADRRRVLGSIWLLSKFVQEP
jgi:hypothetical protein